jgi:membrane protease YdiL (CAAX protease family)
VWVTAVADLRDFVGRYPAGSYFVLTFAISWGGFFLVGGRGFFAGTSWQDDQWFVFAVTALLIGPPVAGVVLTGLVKGRTGFRELAARLRKWRVGVHWYAVALLTAPLAMTVVLLALSLVSPEFLPAPVTTGEFAPLLLGIGWGLAGGFFEELGWTGFATPSLGSRRGVLATGLIVGVLWAAWHLPQGIWTASTASGPIPPILFVIAGFLSSYLLPYRVLMVWVYDRTGSLLVAIVMHASLIASSISGFGLVPPSISGIPFLIMFFAFTGLLWLIVAAVTVVHRGQLSRKQSPGMADVQPAAPGPSSGGT